MKESSDNTLSHEERPIPGALSWKLTLVREHPLKDYPNMQGIGPLCEVFWNLC